MTPTIVEQLDPIFKPRSVAFIGASNNPTKWGQWMVERPLNTGYRGAMYPVNLKEKEIQGIPAYTSIKDIPDAVDLAVITVPAATVPQVLVECAEKGVRGVIIISAGFAELNPEGKALQHKVVQIARDAGIRFLGPNCMGIYSSASRFNLLRWTPHAGPIGFVTQSGTFGMYLAQMANAKGYGLSNLVSIGNQADLTMADYVEYLAQDPATKAIVLYIEGMVEGRRFFEVAQEVVKRKPIIVYKAGRTAAGARATMSHTASLAGDDEVFKAMCEQVGIIRAYETVHPFDMAEALASQPLPAGNRVAILSGGGGHCVATAEACASLGLEVPEFDIETQMAIKAKLLPHSPIPRNPIDLAGGIPPVTVAGILETVAQLDYIDAIITMPPMAGFGQSARPAIIKEVVDAAAIIGAIPSKYGKPVIANFIRSVPGGVAFDVLKNAGIPSYETPEESARALYALAKYAATRRNSDHN